ncbi:MAG: hypothetical protein RIR97_998 [Pseudomonadota bacterium]
MFQNTKRLESPTGANLAYHISEAQGPSRGIVLISHGLAEHSRRYERFATCLSSRGYHVYAWDHRGHGETKALDAPLGRFGKDNGGEKVLADVKAMRDFALSEHPGLPVILFGHSMGGLISLNTVVSYPADFAAVAVWNANFNAGPAGTAAKIVLAVEKFFKGSDVPSSILPKLTFGAWGKAIKHAKTDFDWLSHIDAEVQTYIADPLCGFDASVSLWIDLFDFIFRAPRSEMLGRLPKNFPVHIVGGDEDPASNFGKGMIWLSERLNTFGFTNVTSTVYAKTRHETLNDTVQNQAMADFADWCDRTVQT